MPPKGGFGLARMLLGCVPWSEDPENVVLE